MRTLTPLQANNVNSALLHWARDCSIVVIGIGLGQVAAVLDERADIVVAALCLAIGAIGFCVARAGLTKSKPQEG